MKHLSILLMLLMLLCKASAQYTFVSPSDPPGTCMIDANDARVPAFRDDLKRAVFTYKGDGAGDCTGTLINRNTGEQDMGTYFITSWHCFKSGQNDCGGSEFDFSKDIVFKFNFQSPQNQLGKVFSQNKGVYPTNNDGTVYSMTRKVRLVEHVSCGYGDVAICEILGEPIPPHFNVYYSGWEPAGFFPLDNFTNFSHPNASLKQVAHANSARNGYSGNSQVRTCKTIAKVLDLIISFFKREKRWSTEEICQYVQVPFVDTRLIVFAWSYGTVAGGSSGSALWNGNNKLIGNLSGSQFDLCNAGHFWFGKFQDYYYRSGIKNTLNPSYSWFIDQSGIPGRNKQCHEVINYNYGMNYSFYPASLYQSQNALAFNSRTNVFLGNDLNNKVIIKNGADFTFNAGTNIELGAGFLAENGSSFTAKAGNTIIMKPGFQVLSGANFKASNGATACGYSGSYRMESEEEMYERLAQEQLFAKMHAMVIPESLDLLSTMPTRELAVTIYPNPAKESITIYPAYIPAEELTVTLINSMGIEVFKNSSKATMGREFDLELTHLSNGLYKVILQSGKNRTVQNIVIQK